MATGSTSNFISTRSDIIAAALRKVKSWPEDNNPPIEKIKSTIKALNRILRQEDLKGVQQNKHLWALSHSAVFLAVGGYVYGEDDGLPTSILDLHEASFRNTDGDDTELDIITPEGYARLSSKDETGDPTSIFLKRDRLLADNLLYIHPAPTSIGDTSEVVGTDTLNYKCILGHTSAAINRPITGASYPLYWKQEGSAGAAWVTATDYTNGELIWLSFKRPLFDFDSPYDNPDFPSGWDNYLINKLAVDLAAESTLNTEERGWLRLQLKEAESELFPSSRANANTYHNKTKFF